MAATMLHGRQVQCSNDELSVFQPPTGVTCQTYMAPYLQQAPGYLMNPSATSDCAYCSLSVADQFLSGVNIYWSQRWRNFGLMWVYVVFDIAAAVMLYYFFRVRQGSLLSMFKKKNKSKKTKGGEAQKQTTEGQDARAQGKSGEEEEKKEEEEEKAESDEQGDEEMEQRRRRSSVGSRGSGLVRRTTNTVQGVTNDLLTYNLGRVHTNRRNHHVF